MAEKGGTCVLEFGSRGRVEYISKQGRGSSDVQRRHFPPTSSRAMPPPPFSSPLGQLSFPALYLYPLNDTFVPKHIALIGGQRVKIGRQTNAKTVPAERNGYFDSKVLSRQHAEVWEDNGKVSPFHFIVFSLHTLSPRSSSKTSRVPTVLSSMANVSVQKG